MIPFRQIVLIISFGLLMAFGRQSHAQNRVNYGLTRPQPERMLPQGKAKIQQAVVLPRSGEKGAAVLHKNSLYKLHSGWELTDNLNLLLGNRSIFDEQYDSKAWHDAVVPGTVLTSLVAAGIYPDPYFGLNNLSIPDSLCRKDWWYRTSFETPAGENKKNAWLCFDGINYKSRIWLNGTMLGETRGAFIRARFNVTELLKKTGRNVLLLQVIPPPNPGIPHEQSARSGMGPNGGQLTMDGPTFFASEGWDWMPGIRDRNMGIWQDVKLLFTGNVTVHDPHIITDLPLPDTTKASISLTATIKNNSAERADASIQFSFENVVVSKKISLEAGEAKEVKFSPNEYQQLVLQNPRLWWPNGYGLPQLYHAKIEGIDQNGVRDIKEFRFGIREYSYELLADTHTDQAMRFDYSPTDLQWDKPLLDFTKRREFESKVFIPSLADNLPQKHLKQLADTSNPYLTIKINGVHVFCKGGNWGMDDAMKRVGRERMEPAFRLHKEANFNLIRNWTGQNTEDIFFDLADEYGMMIWNDFWISTEGINLNPNDQQLFLQNSLEVIRHIRNHPSIAIWCPRNEGYAPQGLADELATQVATEDGTRHYHGNSRDINIRTSGPWHFFEDNKEYFTRLAKGFTTEIGTFSIPEASTIRKFIDPLDEWPINDVWHYHDLHADKQNLAGYLHTVDSLYGPSDNLDDFNRKVQLVNYESHRAIFEAWNNQLWNNGSGVLLWMTHPAWPSMIWQTYSWDYQTHGSYYGSKKGCEPVHIQMNLHDNMVMVVNTSLMDITEAKATLQLLRPDGTVVLTKTVKANISANRKTELFTVNLSDTAMPSHYLVRLYLSDKKGSTIATNEYWKTNNHTGNFKAFNVLPNVQLMVHTKLMDHEVMEIVLENKTNTPAVSTRLDALDEKDNILLPAYFSDGYFTLLPGEKRTITYKTGASRNPARLKISGYNQADNVIGIAPLRRNTTK